MEKELIKFIVEYREEVLWNMNNTICEDSVRLILEGEELALRRIQKKIRELLKKEKRPSQNQLEEFWSEH